MSPANRYNSGVMDETWWLTIFQPPSSRAMTQLILTDKGGSFSLMAKDAMAAKLIKSELTCVVARSLN